jgi:hypothetical protein
VSTPAELLGKLQEMDVAKAWKLARDEARRTAPEAADWKTAAHLLGRLVEALRDGGP